MGYAVHHDFKWNRDLLLDLFRGDSGPLGNDIDVVVGYIGIGFNGKLVERDRAPHKKRDRKRQDQESVLQGKGDQIANHLLLHRVLEHKRRLDNLLAWPDAGDDFLQVLGKHLSGDDFNAPEVGATEWYVDPVAVAQMQNRARSEEHT